MQRLTDREQQILAIAQHKPDSWLTFHRNYLGEVLALQCEGLITSRLIDGEHQLKLAAENWNNRCD